VSETTQRHEGSHPGLPELTLKTVVVHTVTYFIAGILAYTLGDYETTLSQPPLSFFMRPTSDPWVMAGPLLQPVRGIIFALAFYPLRRPLFAEKRGWLTLWWLLLALGVFSTFGAAPGSVEGLIYTIVPPRDQVLGLWEVVLQSFLLAVVLVYWVRNPGKRWINVTLGIAFSIVMLLPLMGLLAAPGRAQVLTADSAKQRVLRDKLEKRLQTIASGVDGVMGYAVLDLTTGDRFGHLENEVFPTASTIKIAILYELFRRADEGSIDVDEMRPLDRRHAVGGSGVLQVLGTPSLSLRDYATLMVVVSDNTATNVLIDALGADAITGRMARLGLPATRLRRRMIDLEAARRGAENVSTPAELVRLLQLIHAGEGLSARRRDDLLAILKKAKSSPLRRAIPSTIEVANKPGGLDGVEVDAGLVFVPGRPYVLAVMTTYLRETPDGGRAIEEAARATYDYFSRVATGGEYGRTIR